MNLERKQISIYSLISIILTALFFSFFSVSEAEAQRYRKQREMNQKGENRKLYKDEYSDLDERTHNPVQNKHIQNAMDESKEAYFQGLILIERGDTTEASKYFEKAIEKLNRLASYPDIENNRDFTDLSRSVIEDFEAFIGESDYIDETSPIFILNERLYTETVENEPVNIVDNLDSLDYQEAEKEADSIVAGTERPKISATGVVQPDSISVPLPYNKYVERNIDFLTTEYSRKNHMSRWLSRSTKWFPMMRRIAEDEGVPLEMLHLSMIESALLPNAVSSARAVGLWQFIRSTGKLYGLNKNRSYWVDERRDPEKATRAAMRHMRDLYNEFGNWHLVMAAYNCGAGCVSRAIRRSRKQDPDFWDIRRYLPRETKHYVPLYIATTMIAMNPEKYGYDTDTIDFQEEYAYDVFKLDSAVNLDALAECAGISMEEIKDYNPELIRSSTPPDVRPYYLKIPPGTYDTFAENFKDLDYEEIHPFLTHRIRRGETLSKIARRYGTSINAIVQLNNLRSRRSILHVGQMLEIPVDPNKFYGNDDKVKINPNEDITHTVRRGESLYSIARRYGVNISDLRDFNNISYNNDRIHIGQKLIIAKKSPNASSDDEPEINDLDKAVVVKHTVRRGETLGKISDDYSVSIKSIKKSNSMRSSRIYPGQVLKIIKPGAKDVAEKQEETSTKDKKPVVHRVGRGETLSTIAALYGVTEKQLKSWNPGSIRGNTVYLGTNLKVVPENEYKGSSPAKDDDVKNTPKYYTVRRGDTLISIARKFGISVSSIKELNRTLNPRRLRVGQKIRIQ